MHEPKQQHYNVCENNMFGHSGNWGPPRIRSHQQAGQVTIQICLRDLLIEHTHYVGSALVVRWKPLAEHLQELERPACF